MKVDLIKMLKEFVEEQGYNIEEYRGDFEIVRQCLGEKYRIGFKKSKIEDFLMDIYGLGHDAGYRKGFKARRHIQATMKEERNGIS